MRETWVALWLFVALAGAWRLGLSPIEAGLLASGASALALGLWRLVGRARRRTRHGGVQPPAVDPDQDARIQRV